jgi:hypothetical protein
MTDLAESKPSLEAQVYLNDAELTTAQVCIHLKGFARATVTHLYIEHPSLIGLIPPKVRTVIRIISSSENGIGISTKNHPFTSLSFSFHLSRASPSRKHSSSPASST